jgi:tRNA nucleotidyltransferase/poly(A) polymerase
MTLTELRELLAQAIKDTEFESHTYFAGGCVRDFLLNPETTIIEADIAVELPEGGIKLAYFLQEKFNTSPPLIHKSFGTAKIKLKDITIELVMTRSEKYPPGKRHPYVQFADLYTDCLRRDFTINALYQEIMTGKILDPCQKGYQDLQARVIRSVQDPLHSFAEDPLRILRALRFAVTLDFEISPETLSAIKTNAHLVSTLSNNRCSDEYSRIKKLSPEQIAHWKKLLEETGVLTYLKTRIPELTKL